MKIVDRATFLTMPSGTVYQKYMPSDRGGDICIKGDTVMHVDFVETNLSALWPESCKNSDEFFDKFDAMEKGESSGALDFDSSCRDGLFEEDQMFAVWEASDVKGLLARLHQALSAGYLEPPAVYTHKIVGMRHFSRYEGEFESLEEAVEAAAWGADDNHFYPERIETLGGEVVLDGGALDGAMEKYRSGYGRL